MDLQETIASSKAVLFDLFHTLVDVTDVDSERPTHEILGMPQDKWNELLFDFSEARMRGHIRDKYEITRSLAHQYNSKITEETIREAADCRERRFYKGIAEVESNNVRVIHHLKDAGKKIGLVSNADCIEIAGWKDSPFAPLFDAAVFSFQIAHVKPEAEIYQHALNTLEVDASDAVFVGDGSNQELMGAQRVGLRTIMTREITQHRWPHKLEARAEHADFVIDKMDELIIGLQP